MRLKKRSSKSSKNSSNQLSFEFENSSEIVINIRIPKVSSSVSSNYPVKKKKLTILLGEN
jgi:hypothetical protein